MLHYEDSTLKDLYFLDPQWLCDMLAHVVTIREINPFARNGLYYNECSIYNLLTHSRWQIPAADSTGKFKFILLHLIGL